TLLDYQHLPDIGIGHITARQELREMIAGLAIPDPGAAEPIAAAG
ncbi:MAG TPA: division plane positioning ATPase MipZ, partial [Sphingomicrobium sp.]|nr:division plane positioning ATPase MipZ [Sphingomicrobium sp.]